MVAASTALGAQLVVAATRFSPHHQASIDTSSAFDLVIMFLAGILGAAALSFGCGDARQRYAAERV
jgi:hypothetical protein